MYGIDILKKLKNCTILWSLLKTVRNTASSKPSQNYIKRVKWGALGGGAFKGVCSKIYILKSRNKPSVLGSLEKTIRDQNGQKIKRCKKC